MGLIVRETGLRTWLVDAGRTGARALGVPLGGAADRSAFQLGNALVGNEANAPGLEITLFGPTLLAEHPVAGVVFGAPFEIRINGEREVPAGTTFTLEAGDTLRIGGTSVGCRGYVCVAGGFDSPLKMGSRSAFRPVEKGETLNCRSSRIAGRSLGFVNLLQAPLSLGVTQVHALPGNQADWFPDDTFWNSEYVVAPASDRMGLRFDGPKLTKRSGEMASEAVAPGAVQVANDGLSIVLGVDGQTIGGYPKVAHVVAADLDRLAQLRPGDRVRFQRLGMEQAEELANARRKQIADWQMRLSMFA